MFLSHGAPVRIASALLLVLALYNFYHVIARYFCYGSNYGRVSSVKGGVGRDSLFLTQSQCEAAFPLLNKEIDDAFAASGQFVYNRTTERYAGQVHGRIKDGKVSYVE